jgi:hypothetical protein
MTNVRGGGLSRSGRPRLGKATGELRGGQVDVPGPAPNDRSAESIRRLEALHPWRSIDDLASNGPARHDRAEMVARSFGRGLVAEVRLAPELGAPGKFRRVDPRQPHLAAAAPDVVAIMKTGLLAKEGGGEGSKQEHPAPIMPG